MIFKTTNLLLRPWRQDDAKCLYHFAKNPNVGISAGWPPHRNVEESLNIIKTIFCRPECYAIVKDDIPIGCVELLIHPNGNHWWGEGSAELGYWIAEPYWKKGYATEACKILIRRAFDDLAVDRIYATYKISNTASKRVLEKLDFQFYRKFQNIDYQNNVFCEIAMLLKK